MAATGGTTSYSPLSLLTGTALLPKTTAVAKPVTTVARPATTSAPVSLSNPVLKPVSTMSGSSGSAASSASRPSTTSVKPPAYAALDQALAQRYVAPAKAVATSPIVNNLVSAYGGFDPLLAQRYVAPAQRAGEAAELNRLLPTSGGLNDALNGSWLGKGYSPNLSMDPNNWLSAGAAWDRESVNRFGTHLSGLDQMLASTLGWYQENARTGERRLALPTAITGLPAAAQTIGDMMKRGITGGYTPTFNPDTGRVEDPRLYEDAYTLAQLAMTGGMPMLRPANSLGMGGKLAIPTYEDVLRYAYDNDIEPTHLFQTAKGSTYASFPEQNSVRFKTLHPGHDPEDVGLQPRSIKTVYVDPVHAIDIGGMLRTPEQAVHMIPHPTIPRTLALKRYADYGPSKAGSLAGQYPFEVTPQLGLRPVEIMPDGRIHFGNDIVDLSQY